MEHCNQRLRESQRMASGSLPESEGNCGQEDQAPVTA
jgi:hypothetical protein